MSENIKKLREDLEKILNDKTEKSLKDLKLDKNEVISAFEILKSENTENIDWLRSAQDVLQKLHQMAHQLTSTSELNYLGSSIDFPDFNETLTTAEKEIESSIDKHIKGE